MWDDGHGMDVPTLQRSWLDIATDTKRRKPKSDGGRRVLGEKISGDWRLRGSATSFCWSHGKPMPARSTSSSTGHSSIKRMPILTRSRWPGRSATLTSFRRTAQPPLSSGVRQRDLDTRSRDAPPDREAHSCLGCGRFYRAPHSRTRLIRPRPTDHAVTIDAVEADGSEEGQKAAQPDFQILVELDDVPESLQGFAGPIDPSSDLRTPHYWLERVGRRQRGCNPSLRPAGTGG